MPIGEAGYQRGTPQDTNTCNFVPKRDFQGWDKGNTQLLVQRDNTLPGPLCRVRSAGWSVLLLSAERCTGNPSGKMIPASLETKPLTLHSRLANYFR